MLVHFSIKTFISREILIPSNSSSMLKELITIKSFVKKCRHGWRSAIKMVKYDEQTISKFVVLLLGHHFRFI